MLTTTRIPASERSAQGPCSARRGAACGGTAGQGTGSSASSSPASTGSGRTGAGSAAGLGFAGTLARTCGGGVALPSSSAAAPQNNPKLFIPLLSAEVVPKPMVENGLTSNLLRANPGYGRDRWRSSGHAAAGRFQVERVEAMREGDAEASAPGPDHFGLHRHPAAPEDELRSQCEAG